MQTFYVLIITLLANVLIVRSTNVERTKRDLAFIKKIIAGLFGYNTNNAILSNIKFLYPVPNYQVLMNAMPDPYMNQNIYQGSLSKILVPSNMAIQPVVHYGRITVPYIVPYVRNYKTAYSNFDSSQVNGNMQRVIPIPNYNRLEASHVRCNNEIPVSYRKDVTKDKTVVESSISKKNESHKIPELQSFRNTEEISKEVNAQKLTPPQLQKPENNIITSTTTPRVPKRKFQEIKTTTPTPSSTVEVSTKLSSFYAPTTTPMEQISTKTPPIFSTIQELTTYTTTIGPILTKSSPPLPLTVKNVQKIEIPELTTPLIKNRDEEVKSTTTIRTTTSPVNNKQPYKNNEINNNFNPNNPSKKSVIFTEPIRTRFVYKRINSNKPNEDTVFKMEDIKYPNVSDSQGDLTAQSSMVNNIIDILNNIAPIRGKLLNPLNVFPPQDTDGTLEEIDSNYMEINDQSTDVYPSEELDYLNKSTIGSVLEDGFRNKLNGSEEDFRRIMPSVFETDISRGDIPDV